jgi:hypothetical protein
MPRQTSHYDKENDLFTRFETNETSERVVQSFGRHYALYGRVRYILGDITGDEELRRTNGLVLFDYSIPHEPTVRFRGRRLPSIEW